MLQTRDSDGVQAEGLLGEADPAPFEVVNAGGPSRIVLLCEHAGRAVPKALGDLGLPPAEFERHIAYDIGSLGVARELSAALDAPLILQPYSRLVIDCNRPLGAPDLIPAVSDTTDIAGNVDLDPVRRDARIAAIHAPFHREVRRLLDDHGARHETILVCIHSFTPRLLRDGVERLWELGLLFNRDDRLARRLMDAVRRIEPSIVAEFNEPYAGSDQTDFAIPVHGERRGIEHVLIEIRNDLIAQEGGQKRWSTLLAAAIGEAIGQS